MSKFAEIKTVYKNLDSLVKALRDLGFRPEVATDRKDSLPLRGWRGLENQSVAVRLDMDEMKRVTGVQCRNTGVGFKKAEDGAYTMVQDQHDFSNAAAFEKLHQRYNYHEATRLAKLQGYSVKEKTSTDGTIRLVLVRR
jgi:hypothetical protein